MAILQTCAVCLMILVRHSWIFLHLVNNKHHIFISPFNLLFAIRLLIPCCAACSLLPYDVTSFYLPPEERREPAIISADNFASVTYNPISPENTENYLNWITFVKLFFTQRNRTEWSATRYTNTCSLHTKSHGRREITKRTLSIYACRPVTHTPQRITSSFHSPLSSSLTRVSFDFLCFCFWPTMIFDMWIAMKILSSANLPQFRKLSSVPHGVRRAGLSRLLITFHGIEQQPWTLPTSSARQTRSELCDTTKTRIEPKTENLAPQSQSMSLSFFFHDANFSEYSLISLHLGQYFPLLRTRQERLPNNESWRSATKVAAKTIN